MRNDYAFFEPKAVHVFARLAAIKETEARHLLTQAATRFGGRVSRSGDVFCKDKGSFASMWELASQRLKEVS